MSTLEAETDIESTEQVMEAVEIINCGRASECTRGTAIGILLELGTVPYDKVFF